MKVSLNKKGDPELLDAARRKLGCDTKAEAVRRALKAVLEHDVETEMLAEGKKRVADEIEIDRYRAEQRLRERARRAMLPF